MAIFGQEVSQALHASSNPAAAAQAMRTLCQAVLQEAPAHVERATTIANVALPASDAVEKGTVATAASLKRPNPSGETGPPAAKRKGADSRSPACAVRCLHSSIHVHPFIHLFMCACMCACMQARVHSCACKFTLSTCMLTDVDMDADV